MVKTRKQMVGKVVNGYRGTNGRKYITIHETANTSRGADAQAHANLQTNGFSASWHWQVDDKEAIQSFPHTAQLWHAGDGRGNGNTNSIGIEICVNSDGNFGKAVENAAALTRQIMADEGISLGNVVQHNHWSGKNCPTNLRNGRKGVNWADFKRMVGDKNAKPSSSKPNKPVTSKPSSSGGKYTGNSVVEYLVSVNEPSGFNDRKKLAIKHGISGYKGTAAQNLQLLQILRNDSKKSPSKPKSTTKGTVADIQRKLNRYRVNSITVDNKYGPATHKALVKAYQYELNRQFNAGLAVDGIPGPATDKAAVVLRYNRTYSNLAHLTQAFLYFKGEKLKVDGYWQAESIRATKSFQRKHGLTEDGLPGKATFKILIRR